MTLPLSKGPAPTFEDLASANVDAKLDRVSLAALLFGRTLSEWRSVALVEHQGPVRVLHDGILAAHVVPAAAE